MITLFAPDPSWKPADGVPRTRSLTAGSPSQVHVHLRLVTVFQMNSGEQVLPITYVISRASMGRVGSLHSEAAVLRLLLGPCATLRGESLPHTRANCGKG